MQKLVNKKDVEYRNGFYLYKDNVISIGDDIKFQTRKLERAYQKGKLIDKNSKATMPEQVDINQFISEHDAVMVSKPKTPQLDKSAKEATKRLNEIESLENYEDSNNLIEAEFKDLACLVSSNEVLITDCYTGREDHKLLGNVCELTEEQFLKAVKYAAITFKHDMEVEFRKACECDEVYANSIISNTKED